MRKFLDPAGSLISEAQEDGHVVVIETGDPRFEEWAATAAPYEPDMLALATEARARRDQAIASGIVTVGDAPILTDDTTQQRLTAVALAVTLDPAATIRWKCADGHFRVLDAAQVIAAAQAVRAYVQACYDREAELLAALDAGEPVDVDAGWP